MLNWIDRLLDKITMYRLALYTLVAFLIAAAVFGAFGILPYSPAAIAFSTVTLIVACWVANDLLAKLFKAQTNSESSLITALILALIITPVAPIDLRGLAFLLWASVFAMASKYVLAIGKKHVFNPAAIAVVLTAFALGQYASWWIGGNLPMLGFVLVGGLLITRKLKHFDLVLAGTLGALVSFVLTNPSLGPLETLERAFIHTPLLFFVFIMLTEPLTTPPTRGLRITYGAIVGLLFSPAVSFGAVSMTPELALSIGNIYSYIVSPKWKHMLTLKEKREIGGGIWHFTFEPLAAAGGTLAFKPGQYLEWTLGHENPDGRGNRRYFTVASSPTEQAVQIGVRFYDPSSSFKKTLGALQPGATIGAAGLAGDFTLPADQNKKLAFIAGGIGITPFRSMAKYLADRGEHRDITLLYSSRTAGEIAYRDVFDEAAARAGLKTVYVTTESGTRIDATLIAREIPDYRQRTFYISGTHAMVSTFQHTLHEMGVPRVQIKTDFFPGFEA